MGNSIQFILPTGILQKYIDIYYFIELNVQAGANEFVQKPISNGCIELFISYQNSMGTCYTNQGVAVRVSSAIIGTHNLKNNLFAKALESTPNVLKFVDINFKINGFYDIFKMPPSALYNGVFEADLIIGPDIKLLQSQLDEAKCLTEKKNFVELFLIRHYIKNRHKNFKIETGFKIAEFIRYKNGNVRIQQIVSEFSVAERTLQRGLNNTLGLSPKELSKIVRFNKLLNFISNKKKINWSDIVSYFGYYDQTHFINEFKATTCFTPEVFMNNKNVTIFKVTNHLVTLKPSVVSGEVHHIMELGHEYTF